MSEGQTLRRWSCRRLAVHPVEVLVAVLTNVEVQHCPSVLNEEGKSLARRAFVLCGKHLQRNDFLIDFCID